MRTTIMDSYELQSANKTGYFMIVTANEYEKRSLEYYYSKQTGLKLYNSENCSNSYIYAQLGKYKIMHLHLKKQGSFRPEAATAAIMDARQELSPKAVFVLGIAFGFTADKQNLGDILISEKLLPYETTKKTTTESGLSIEKSRNEAIQVSDKLIILCNNVKRIWRKNHNIHVFSGGVVTGEKLVDDRNFKTLLQGFFEDENIIGGEMEGIGAAIACFSDIDYIIIKGICDWGENKESPDKDAKQIYAAQNCMHFCYNIFCSDELGRKYTMVPSKRVFATDCYLVNAYNLYYYRQLRKMSMCELSYKTGISEKDLARYESLGDPILYTNTYGFAKATYGNILKLEKILQCQGEIIGDADINQERKCLFEKKEKNPPIIPVTDAEAVVFDFDGTLTTNEYGRSSWQDLWTLLGDPENLCSQYHKLYKTHIITHAQWCKMTQQYFSEHNLTEAMVVEYAKGKSLIKDFEEAIKILNEEKIKIYICSGSINTIIQTVVSKNMQYIEDCKYNTFEYHNGVLSEIKGTQYDFEGKRDFVKRVMADNDIDPDKVVFVGNSDNDVLVHEAGARTIVVNPNQINPNTENWDYYIENFDSLLKILPYVKPTKYTVK